MARDADKETEAESRFAAAGSFMLRRPATWVVGAVILAALVLTCCTWAARNDTPQGSTQKGVGPLAFFETFFNWFAANADVYVTIATFVVAISLGIGQGYLRWEESLRMVLDVDFLDEEGKAVMQVRSVPLGGESDVRGLAQQVGKQLNDGVNLDMGLNNDYAPLQTARIETPQRSAWVRRAKMGIPLKVPLRCESSKGDSTSQQPCRIEYDPFTTKSPRCSTHVPNTNQSPNASP